MDPIVIQPKQQPVMFYPSHHYNEQQRAVFLVQLPLQQPKPSLSVTKYTTATLLPPKRPANYIEENSLVCWFKGTEFLVHVILAIVDLKSLKNTYPDCSSCLQHNSRKE